MTFILAQSNAKESLKSTENKTTHRKPQRMYHLPIDKSELNFGPKSREHDRVLE